MTNQPDITLYDKYDYDYSQYWKERKYEHEAEVKILNKVLAKQTGAWFIDIGGSYGRHVPQYYQKFHQCIILDYSLNSLRQAHDILRKKGIHNVHLVAANAYNIPIREKTIDMNITIRLIHHIEKPEKIFDEILRILKPGGRFLLEYPNKIHLKSIFRSILRLNLKYLTSLEPIEVPTEGHEGSQKSERGIMYNFHPRYIKKAFVSREIEHFQSYSLSFLRSPILKGIVPHSILIRIEYFLQFFLGWTQLTPSIIVTGVRKRQEQLSIRTSKTSSKIEDLLVCPKCKGTLTRRNSSLTCPKCNRSFSKVNGIYDLRYPLLPK
jgi:ubiquinone/menaquinone biosynthesis C-methylase UbiE